MIIVEISRDKAGAVCGIKCRGHAEYAESGSDVVCAAVSILVINSINAIEKLSDTKLKLNGEDQAEGIIDVSFETGPDAKAEVILDTMLLGLNDVMVNYGKKYLKLVETSERR